MNKYNTSTGMKPYQGVIISVIGLLAMIFIGSILQTNFKGVGVILSELMLAILAVAFVIMFGGNLKRVFPFKRVKIRQIIGVLILWIGTYCIAIMGTMVIAVMFPEKIAASSETMNYVLEGVGFLSSIFIIAVVPAICEEVLMRGAILSCFRGFKHKWSIIIIVGIIFSIYHLDPVKLFSTAVIGITLGYIILETDNIILPMVYHFWNNAFSIIVSYLAANLAMGEASNQIMASSQVINSSMIMTMIGSYLIIGTIIPFSIYFGVKLIHSKEENLLRSTIRKERGRINPVYIAAICTGIIFITGVIVLSVSTKANLL